MPYISDEMKQAVSCNVEDSTLEESVDDVISHIRSYDSDDREGLCNYAISRIVAGGLKPATGWRYKNLNRAYGTFMSAANEFYRRLVVNYENKCIEKNGDIKEYEEK